MVDFARHYMDFLRLFLDNIVTFFRRIFASIGKFFGTDIANYFNDFFNASKGFGFLDWLIAIIVILVNLLFLSFLFIKLFQWLRKYVRFTKKEIEKDALLEEVAILSQKAIELTSEKNEILKLKMESFGLNPDLFEGQTKEEKTLIESRFTKLIEVDKKYNLMPLTTNMLLEDQLTLEELVGRFINFSASRLNLYYSGDVIRSYFAGMAASKILILEGISGTGKTSLPYAMGQFFNNPAAIIPVQPSWRDKTEMVGYLNEFTKKFNETDFLKHLYETTYRDDLNFIVLDELNLARIEYYFAEFLSIMEMPNAEHWQIDIVPSAQKGDPKNLINGKVTVPQNVWFVGTANKDDSTFTITDKVYDRASSIEMNRKADFVDAPDTESIRFSYDYLIKLFEVAWQETPITIKAMRNLELLDDFIAQNFKITFGNRILNQIKLFVPVYVAAGGTETEALDYIITRKILRKFETLNLPFLQDELTALDLYFDKLFGKNQFIIAKEFIKTLRQMM